MEASGDRSEGQANVINQVFIKGKCLVKMGAESEMAIFETDGLDFRSICICVR